jgi:hypothetical protein
LSLQKAGPQTGSLRPPKILFLLCHKYGKNILFNSIMTLITGLCLCLYVQATPVSFAAVISSLILNAWLATVSPSSGSSACHRLSLAVRRRLSLEALPSQAVLTFQLRHWLTTISSQFPIPALSPQRRRQALTRAGEFLMLTADRHRSITSAMIWACRFLGKGGQR